MALRNAEGPLGSILFVDDDEPFGEASAKALRSAGYDVDVAPDYRLGVASTWRARRAIDLLVTG